MTPLQGLSLIWQVDEFVWNNYKFIIKSLENRRIDTLEMVILDNLDSGEINE